MNLTLTRRSVLAAIAAALPLAATAKAQALTKVSSADAHYPTATGVWATLEHATDGTNPSTALSLPPNFTPAIKALAGKEIELTGYLTPLAGGFGKKPEYLLSRESFHCPYCYAFGRASLALAYMEGHILPTSGKVSVRGTLALQSNDPTDFYFQIKNARVA
jgi:uncharacterized protein